MLVSPSLLSADFSKLAEESARMEQSGSDWLHLDVIDGVFAPNITFGVPVIKALRSKTNLVFDVHLMIQNPLKYVEAFAKAGADFITFHIESESDPLETIRAIHSFGLKAGVALKPGTPLQAVLGCADEADMILVMSVEPGFSGQKFMPEVMPKLAALKERFAGTGKYLQVDGGVSKENIALIAQNGANVAVSGNSVFCAQNPKEVIEYFHSF